VTSVFRDSGRRLEICAIRRVFIIASTPCIKTNANARRLSRHFVSPVIAVSLSEVTAADNAH
jgi:hypothetical protein